jgi:glycosyltransferase involved in cell wall biosynthesis
VALAGVAAGVAALLPLHVVPKAALWFLLAAAMWMLVSWNRGLLIGLGRLGLVGGSVVFEGCARLGLAVLLVARGWQVAGASAGLALGIGAAMLLTEAMLPRGRAQDGGALTSDVWLATAGLLFLSLAQFPDVIAVRLLDPHGAGAYTAASSLARIALYAQAPAAAYALRRTAVAGARRSRGRVLLLALAPAAVALAVLEVFPRRLLSLTYGGRYLGSVELIRILGVAMLLAGLALVLISVLMGAGRSAWAWSIAVAAVAGVAIVFAVGATPMHAAVAMAGTQAVVLAVAAAHARRLFATGRTTGAVLFLNWRDTGHPQGGGSEVFVEEVAGRLAAQGRRVTVFCAEHDDAPRDELRDGVRFVRRGSWRTVYLWAGIYHVLGRFGPHDVVVDVQNAVPFFSPLYCGRKVLVLVHHVHREQWRMIFGPRVARAGWWLESRLSPKLYRRAGYVTVSDATRSDLIAQGIVPERISVVRNGAHDLQPTGMGKAERPTIVYLGRLVPHKRVELLLDAAAALRPEFPDLHVRLVGRGPWEGRLRTAALELGIQDAVTFDGYVDGATRDRILARSWVACLPSVREGWGLAVMEAAAAGTPAVAFRAGGLRECIADGETGLLAVRFTEFVESLRWLLRSGELREELGRAARVRSLGFTWEATTEGFAAALDLPEPVPAVRPAVEAAALPEPLAR